MMRSIRLVTPGTDPELVNVSVPEPPDGWVRIAMRACGICGSDLHIIDGSTAPGQLPLVLGHEASGVVDALGRGVTDLALLERVVINPLVSCAACPMCSSGRANLCPSLRILGLHLDGAHAEFLVVPRRNVHRLPDAIGFAQGAVIADAVGSPFHAIELAGLSRGSTVAVFGLGGLGLHAVLLLKQVVGAYVIGVDVYDEALDRATAFGVDEVIDARPGRPSDMILASAGGVDAAFDFVGATSVVEQGLRALRPGGTCVVVGVTPDRMHLNVRLETVVGRGLRLIGSMGYTGADIERLLSLVSTGDLNLDGTISHSYDLGQYQLGLQTLRDRSANPIRVVITNEREDVSPPRTTTAG